MYVKLINVKKMLLKLKNVYTAISKYNLSGPVLMQFYIENNELEVVLSHSIMRNKFDTFQLFNNVTYDSFEIDEDEIKLFSMGDELSTSLPIIVSSSKIDTETIIELSKKEYRYSKESYYVFPKYMLLALKNDVITGFEMQYNDNTPRFDMIIERLDIESYNNKLIILNNNYLESIFKSNVLPFFNTEYYTQTRDLLYNLYNPDSQTYFHMNGKDEIKQFLKQFENNDYIKHTDSIGNIINIYHNMFLRINLTLEEVFILKRYEDTKRNIVSCYVKLRINNGTFIYFKYIYGELQGDYF